MNGYIWIYRKLLDWEWFREPNTLQLFICLVLRANWSDSKWKGIDVKRGQLITSVASLCEATGQTPRSIRTGINRLKSTGEVTIKTTNKYSLVTIENWALYQPDKDETTNKTTSTTTNERQTNDKQTTTDEEYNKKEEEYKEDKQDKYLSDLDSFFEKAWKLYPRKEGKGSVSKTQKKKLYDLGDEFIRCIERYIQKRNGKDPKYTQMGSTFFNSGYVDYLDINYGQPIFQQPTIEVNTGPQVPNYRSED